MSLRCRPLFLPA
uniref:Uncharacterized protein n=1 Tax=Arundo donax TaxID=35708 RepID=A0A0A8ZRQ4_ARUDO